MNSLTKLAVVLMLCVFSFGVTARGDVNPQDVIAALKAGKGVLDAWQKWNESHPKIPAIDENGKRVFYLPFVKEGGTRVTWNMDQNEFHGAKAREILVEIINVNEEDRAKIRLQAKEDKKGRSDPNRGGIVGHGDKAPIGVTSAARGVYFAERWGDKMNINTLLLKNPNAGVKVTILRALN